MDLNLLLQRLVSEENSVENDDQKKQTESITNKKNEEMNVLSNSNTDSISHTNNNTTKLNIGDICGMDLNDIENLTTDNDESKSIENYPEGEDTVIKNSNEIENEISEHQELDPEIRSSLTAIIEKDKQTFVREKKLQLNDISDETAELVIKGDSNPSQSNTNSPERKSQLSKEVYKSLTAQHNTIKQNNSSISPSSNALNNISHKGIDPFSLSMMDPETKKKYIKSFENNTQNNIEQDIRYSTPGGSNSEKSDIITDSKVIPVDIFKVMKKRKPKELAAKNKPAFTSLSYTNSSKSHTQAVMNIFLETQVSQRAMELCQMCCAGTTNFSNQETDNNKLTKKFLENIKSKDPVMLIPTIRAPKRRSPSAGSGSVINNNSLSSIANSKLKLKKLITDLSLESLRNGYVTYIAALKSLSKNNNMAEIAGTIKCPSKSEEKAFCDGLYSVIENNFESEAKNMESNYIGIKTILKNKNYEKESVNFFDTILYLKCSELLPFVKDSLESVRRTKGVKSLLLAKQASEDKMLKATDLERSKSTEIKKKSITEEALNQKLNSLYLESVTIKQHKKLLMNKKIEEELQTCKQFKMSQSSKELLERRNSRKQEIDVHLKKTDGSNVSTSECNSIITDLSTSSKKQDRIFDKMYNGTTVSRTAFLKDVEEERAKNRAKKQQEALQYEKEDEWNKNLIKSSNTQIPFFDEQSRKKLEEDRKASIKSEKSRLSRSNSMSNFYYSAKESASLLNCTPSNFKDPEFQFLNEMSKIPTKNNGQISLSCASIGNTPCYGSNTVTGNDNSHKSPLNNSVVDTRINKKAQLMLLSKTSNIRSRTANSKVSVIIPDESEGTQSAPASTVLYKNQADVGPMMANEMKFTQSDLMHTYTASVPHNLVASTTFDVTQRRIKSRNPMLPPEFIGFNQESLAYVPEVSKKFTPSVINHRQKIRSQREDEASMRRSVIKMHLCGGGGITATDAADTLKLNSASVMYNSALMNDIISKSRSGSARNYNPTVVDEKKDAEILKELKLKQTIMTLNDIGKTENIITPLTSAVMVDRKGVVKYDNYEIISKKESIAETIQRSASAGMLNSSRSYSRSGKVPSISELIGF